MDHTRMRPRADAREVFAAIREHLGDRRFTGRSSDATVSATVDGSGALRGLSIADVVFRGAFPERAGPEIVAAVRAARRAAEETRDRLTEQFFDPARPDPDLSAAPRPERPRPARAREEIVDDDFDQIDFVRPSNGPGRS
jgi:DNA-binding protein YbaB